MWLEEGGWEWVCSALQQGSPAWPELHILRIPGSACEIGFPVFPCSQLSSVLCWYTDLCRWLRGGEPDLRGPGQEEPRLPQRVLHQTPGARHHLLPLQHRDLQDQHRHLLRGLPDLLRAGSLHLYLMQQNLLAEP